MTATAFSNPISRRVMKSLAVFAIKELRESTEGSGLSLPDKEGLLHARRGPQDGPPSHRDR